MRDTLGVLGRVPVSVMIGELDRLISPALGLELAGQIPGAELVWVAGAGHALILECPDLVNESITALVARATSGQVTRERSASASRRGAAPPALRSEGRATRDGGLPRRPPGA